MKVVCHDHDLVRSKPVFPVFNKFVQNDHNWQDHLTLRSMDDDEERRRISANFGKENTKNNIWS